MSCCCNKTFNYCVPVNSCTKEELVSILKDLPDGIYKIRLDGLGKSILKEFEISEGEVTIDIKLNESLSYRAQVLTENLTPVSMTFDGVEYDCFMFKTYL